MGLKEFVETLDEIKQYKLALELTEKTLQIWNDYARSNKLEYEDTVVGMHHTVERDILSRTLQTIKKELGNPKSQTAQLLQLTEEFRDPIVAMQDLDWELPYPVEMTFYSIRNLLDKLNGQNTTVFGDSQIYLVINQAIDALEKSGILTEKQILELLNNYNNDPHHQV